MENTDACPKYKFLNQNPITPFTSFSCQYCQRGYHTTAVCHEKKIDEQAKRLKEFNEQHQASKNAIGSSAP
jgi:hypothetical protein